MKLFHSPGVDDLDSDLLLVVNDDRTGTLTVSSAGDVLSARHLTITETRSTLRDLRYAEICDEIVYQTCRRCQLVDVQRVDTLDCFICNAPDVAPAPDDALLLTF